MPAPRPWRIAFCITELDPGGAERQLVRLASGLDRTRFEPSVVCLSGPGPLVEPLERAGVPVVCLNARGRRDVGVVWRLRRHFLATRPDLVQTFLFHANVAGRVAARLAGVRRVVSGLRVAERRSKWPLRLDRWTDRLVDRHVCVSEDVARFSRNTAGLPMHKLVVIPNGVDQERFAAAAPTPLEPLGVPAGKRAVLFVGRLEEQKDPLRLVEAFRLLLATEPEAHLLIVGTGPLEAAVRRAAEGMDHQVHLLGQRDDVPGLMKAAACLALPSRWEGMPNVVLEAMAAGLPVVAAPVEGVAELLDNGRLGTVCHAAGAAAFAEAMTQALGDHCMAFGRALEAQAFALKRFSIQGCVAAYEELYAGLLAGGGKLRRIVVADTEIRSGGNLADSPQSQPG